MSTTVPLAGVIGDPVGHSASPRLHGHWLREYGLSGHYVPLEIRAEDLATVLAALPRAGFVGANVTIPHKQTALALAAEATERARRIGAANTLTFTAGGIVADCTDGVGFLANLADAVPDWQAASGPAVVFGAGGAARAVVDALLRAGVPELRLVNRTRARADALAKAAGGPVRVIDWDKADAAAVGAGLLVNTTSLGMAGNPPFEVSLAGALPGAVATDIVYTPLETPFLQRAAAMGAQTVDGLGMLLHQAVPGFARWFGVTPAVTAETRAAVLAG